jgi:hypothetical protein
MENIQRKRHPQPKAFEIYWHIVVVFSEEEKTTVFSIYASVM